MQMAYQNRFVVTIIKDGHIMKELANGSVPIEFGSEYKIRLRNKHNRRAVCNLSIDGENVSGGGFIIPANSFIDIERPVDVAKKFKFVSLESEEAYDFGKNGSNHNKIKGTIVAEFALEKEHMFDWVCRPMVKSYPYGYDNIRYGCDNIVESKTSTGYISNTSVDGLLKSKDESFSLRTKQLSSMNAVQSCSSNLQDGATVEGSKSHQSFQTAYFNSENNWTTVRLFLQGFEPQPRTENVKVVEIKDEVKFESVDKDQELIDLERELLELQKKKARREIEKLKAELA
jgi:hypothetical protein